MTANAQRRSKGDQTDVAYAQGVLSLLAELERSEAKRNRYWQALTDIAGLERWQMESGPSWREIAQRALES